MGSLDEDELVKMVQDFIESESISSANTISSNSSNSHAVTHRTQYLILQDILKSEGDTVGAEAKVLKHVLKHMRSKQVGFEKTVTSLNKRLVMRLKIDGFNASLCQTSWSTSTSLGCSCPAGEYEYVQVIIEDERYGNPVKMIVDIDFRSQFELARPTQEYRELTESLPVIFVGTEKKVCKIISLLCSEAKQSLREKGLHVPPWRTTTYMQSKWLCHNNKEHESSNGNRESDYNSIGDNWVPPIVRPKKRDLGGGGGGGGSALSSQFSNMSMNYCYV